MNMAHPSSGRSGFETSSRPADPSAATTPTGLSGLIVDKCEACDLPLSVESVEKQLLCPKSGKRHVPQAPSGDLRRDVKVFLDVGAAYTWWNDMSDAAQKTCAERYTAMKKSSGSGGASSASAAVLAGESVPHAGVGAATSRRIVRAMWPDLNGEQRKAYLVGYAPWVVHEKGTKDLVEAVKSEVYASAEEFPNDFRSLRQSMKTDLGLITRSQWKAHSGWLQTQGFFGGEKKPDPELP